ncbi:MAG TPA: hypothetical protein VN854_01165 [Mycoplasmatales bacterium]|nr:hypothetical protein [Mycoplasmatales bacterium]
MDRIIITVIESELKKADSELKILKSRYWNDLEKLNLNPKNINLTRRFNDYEQDLNQLYRMKNQLSRTENTIDEYCDNFGEIIRESARINVGLQKYKKIIELKNYENNKEIKISDYIFSTFKYTFLSFIVFILIIPIPWIWKKLFKRDRKL